MPWTAIRYGLLQLPELAMLTLVLILIRRWTGFSDWLYAVVLGLWILKIILLYPLVRTAYLPNPHRPGSSMIGERGTVKKKLSPEGYVSARGELWRARLREDGSSAEPGERVRILDVRGLTLIVTPEEDGRD